MSNDISVKSNSVIFDPVALQNLSRFAEIMSSSKVTVPKHLQDKPGDCLAIALQAHRWGMDPFVVAQKTHLVGSTLGYEAQLVNAVISSSAAIRGRFHYEYGGDWLSHASASSKNEQGLFVRVGAILAGEEDITWGEPLYLSSVATRNSPLWKTAPKQQIAYLAVKYWARMYCPGAILGVYSVDELEEKEVTPSFTVNQKNEAVEVIVEECVAVETVQVDHEKVRQEALNKFSELVAKANDARRLDVLYSKIINALGDDNERIEHANLIYSARYKELEEMTQAAVIDANIF